jgi:myo-inositol 2-dehydrogenase / D-chiro-inositol 1-dehydrogenase
LLNIALFGAGFIGCVHARNIARHPRTRLRYVYDVNREAAQRVAAEHGATIAHDSADIWAASDVDAVLIASSTNTHAALLHAAIKAKLPVYCEKPIDLDIERVQGVVEAAHRSATPLMIGFSRRYDDNHRALRDAVRNDEVGTVEMIHMTARGPTPPPLSYIAVSGGQFRDQTIHFFDLLCWIANAAPTEVYATGAALVEPGIGEAGDIDTSMLVLRMPGGALVHIDNSRRAAYGYDERIEVFGSAGMVVSERKPQHEVTRYTSAGVVGTPLHSGWFERMEPTFELALDDFINAVEGQPSSYPTLMDGFRAQLIAEAAVQSLRTNMPVQIGYEAMNMSS